MTGIRFYKGATNTGTHVGHLWTTTGQLLATATFTGETASGWQEVSLGSPVAITANTTYVVSYHAPRGNYAVTDQQFLSAGVDNPPLHALRNGDDGGNGVYGYGPSGTFPNGVYRSEGYWVDVVVETDTGPDTKAPTVTGRLPAAGRGGRRARLERDRFLQRGHGGGEHHDRDGAAAQPGRQPRARRRHLRQRRALPPRSIRTATWPTRRASRRRSRAGAAA